MLAICIAWAPTRAANPQHRHLGDVHQKEAGAVEAHKQVVDLDGVGRVIAKHLV